MEDINDISNIKIKLWGIISLNKRQILILQLVFLTLFIGITIFLFAYDFKPHLDDAVYTFHAKYAKYFSLACTFLVVVEAQYFWTQFTKKQLDIIKAQKNELDKRNRKIKQSLNYASNLQRVILPNKSKLHKLLKEHFILFRPKDLVSGDFYWIEEYEDKTIVAVADCTGHGVPGAFLSAMGISFLNEIVQHSRIKGETISPATILKRLKEHLQHTAQNSEDVRVIDDGMDISICMIDKSRHQYSYAGALMSILHVSNIDGKDGSVAKKLKSNLLPLSMLSSSRIKETYTDTIIDYQENDIIYLYSDGYEDQFGGEKDKKFMYKRFAKLIREISKLPMSEQLEELSLTLDQWKQNTQQIDDITVMGIKL